MIEVIPLNEEEIELARLDIVNVSESYLFATSICTISKLIAFDNYPINKTKAIINILRFLNDFDSRYREFDDISPSYHFLLLRKFFRDHKRYMDILFELKILKKKRYDNGVYYAPNKSSTRYEYFDNKDFKDICLVVISVSIRMSCEFDDVVDSKYKYTILNTTIDVISAIKDELSFHLSRKDSRTRQLQSRLSIMLNLLSNRKITIGTKTRRIRNSFCSISKMSRSHLSLNGNGFHSIDVKNCQPLLLAWFLKSKGLPVDDIYLSDCQNGVVYDVISNKIRKTRSDTKIDLYKSIFFSFRPSKNNAGKCFLDTYNLTSMSINYFLESTEETMASILQNIEADIFNSLRVKHSEGYFTVYDEVFFTDIQDKGYLIEQIRSLFTANNLQVDTRYNKALFQG